MKYNEHGMSVLCPYVVDNGGVTETMMSRLRIPAGWDKRKIRRCIRHFYSEDLGINIDASGITRILKSAVRNEYNPMSGREFRDRFMQALNQEDAETTSE